MKFKEIPTPENFVLTNKKKRIIKSEMRNFIASKIDVMREGFFPKPLELKEFMTERICFLKNNEDFVYIVVTFKRTGEKKENFFGLQIFYQNHVITSL